MRNNILSVILGLTIFSASLSAQTNICIGSRDTVFSDILREERTYWVHLPENYSDSIQKKYPVIYLLDGDLFFHALVALQRSYSRGRQPVMPECIIVGILNTDRTRDLTPSKSSYRRDGKKYADDEETGGGSELFTDFLTNELKPKINKTYRTNTTNVIIGHSFGGLFVVNTLLRHSQLFDIYVALDPSFWWDNGKLQQEADKLLETKQFKNIKFYVGIATKIRPDVNNINSDVAHNFIEKTLPKAIKNGLQVNYKIFSDESHGTIPVPGMSDALKIIFQ
ncbi:MAG: prolyl oligopeptidase family serine peptidase [Prevotellaceae bacterium]|jgi:predicted alpha/beta superfamily hydrolase|nr:prolyl oligopeptidase family serine peptidase [Prevotellaceae bacterium]